MSCVRSNRNKTTELKFIKLLKSLNIKGWRRNSKEIGSPDFVFNEMKIAIFIDGCFWHGCPKHLRLPSSNRKYWKDKISRNKERDKKASVSLRKIGWMVYRFWEHELKKNGKSTVNKIEKIKQLLNCKVI